jgi:hypothetical protein
LNHELVASLAVGLQHHAAAPKKDDSVVVMLLGLYEVSSTPEKLLLLGLTISR